MKGNRGEEEKNIKEEMEGAEEEEKELEYVEGGGHGDKVG